MAPLLKEEIINSPIQVTTEAIQDPFTEEAAASTAILGKQQDLTKGKPDATYIVPLDLSNKIRIITITAISSAILQLIAPP